jgi:hypothetical protein
MRTILGHRTPGMTNGLLVVAFAILVTLVTAAQAKPARATALPIPSSIAREICPMITAMVRSVDPASKIVYWSRTIRPREVHCIYHKGRAIMDTRVTRVGRCVWRLRMTLNGFLIATEDRRIWCV